MVTAVGRGSDLELVFQNEVALPQRTLFKFDVQGYNTRLATQDKGAPFDGGKWRFLTRNSDSEKTVLDRKLAVPGLDLMGVIYMDSMVPDDTKIGVVENRVKMTLR